MADSYSRFAVLDENEIQNLKEKAKNENTQKSTQTWLKVWRSWAEERNVNPNLEENPPVILDEILQRFYAEVRNKNGDHYEPESLKVMMASLDRHLRDQGYPFSITKDREFHQSKQVLEGRAKLLRKERKDKRPNVSKAGSILEEDELWENEKLGSGSPRTLCQTMWWILTQHFGLRGREVHYSMTVEDLKLCRDDRGVEYFTLSENPTKTRQGGLNTKRRLGQPKMFATGGARCPVGLLKEYLCRRPPELLESGPFYLAIIDRPTTDVWYKKQRLGVNSINQMMKTVIESTSVSATGKRLTNYSAWKSMQKGKAVKTEAPSPQKLQVRVVAPPIPRQQTAQVQKKYIIHQANGQQVVLTPVSSQPAQNALTQVATNVKMTPVVSPVNQTVKAIAAPTNTQNAQQPGLRVVKVFTHGSPVLANTKPVLVTASAATQGAPMKVEPLVVPKVGGPTVTKVEESHVPKVGGPPVMLKVNSHAAAKHVANLPTMVPVTAIVVDPSPKVVSVQSLAAPEQNYSLSDVVQQAKPIEAKPQSDYKPLESLIEVNRHAAESSISPVSAVIPDNNTSSSSMTSPTLGRKDVTVNDRFRYIAPSGKTPISSHSTTNTPGPQGETLPQVKLETPTPLDVAETGQVKTEPQQSTPSPVSQLKRPHNDDAEADETPRKRIADSAVIVIDPPSPPKDTYTDNNPDGTDIAVSKTEANTSTIKVDTNDMDDGNSQKQKTIANVDKNIIPIIDISIVEAVKKMSPQQQFKALLSRTQQLYELRGNVCKLLRVLVPELEVDDRKENFEDQTVDELLQQVLEQAETSESESNT